MGSNRRYGSDVSDAVLNEVLIRPRPISLSDAEIGTRITKVDEPVPVRAWVRFPESPIQVDGQAVAWTPRAVRVEFELRDGARLSAWVWASAVDKL